MYQVIKRDGHVAEFSLNRISSAIMKAFDATHIPYAPDVIDLLSLQVTADYADKIRDGRIDVETIQDSVEAVLQRAGYAEVAKAYILYRKNREQFGAEQGHQRFNSDVLQDLLLRAFLADVTELLRQAVNALKTADGLQTEVSLVDAGCEVVVVGGDGRIGFRPVIVLVQPLKSNLAFLYQASMNQFALEVVPFQLALECFNGSRKIECCGVDVHLRWFASRDRTLLPSFCISSGYYRWSSISVPTSAGFKQFSHISEDAVVQ